MDVSQKTKKTKKTKKPVRGVRERVASFSHYNVNTT